MTTKLDENGLANQFAEFLKTKGIKAKVRTPGDLEAETNEIRRKRQDTLKNAAKPTPEPSKPYKPLGGYDTKSNRSFSESHDPVQSVKGFLQSRK